MDPETIQFIKNQLAKNTSVEEIRNLLKINGWNSEQIDLAFKAAVEQTPEQVKTTGNNFAEMITGEMTLITTQTFKNIRKNFISYFLIQTLLFVITIIFIIMVISAAVLFRGSISAITDAIELAAIIYLYLFLVPCMAMYYAILDEEHTHGVFFYLKQGFLHVWKLWLGVLISVLMIIGLALAAKLIILLVLGIFNLPQIIWNYYSQFLFNIAAFAFISNIIFSPYIVIEQKKGVFDSFRESRALVSEHLGAVMVHTFLFFLLITLVDFLGRSGKLLLVFVILPFVQIYFYMLYTKIKA